MSAIFLQIWGGGFYLLNKYYFSRAERSKNSLLNEAFLLKAWAAYLCGLPAWIIVFIEEHNWIAAAIELGGAPSMLIGLIAAWKKVKRPFMFLDIISKLSVLVGLGLSVHEFGGITTFSQALEIGIATGFLMGTYSLARGVSGGYYWLILGNLSCSSLMAIEGYYILMAQQLLSLVFICDAFWSIKFRRVDRRKSLLK
jgi:hypothetical protein